MNKVLFITALFYPQNLIGTLRIGQWCKYLDRNDYMVFVLTTKKYPFMGPFGLEEKLSNKINVIEVDFLPKYLKKIFTPTNISINENCSNIPDKIYYIKLLVRKMRYYIGSLFDLYDLWINPALKEAQKIIEKEKINFIISSYSPPAVVILANKLKKIYPDIRWIADFRDLWAYNHISHAKGILGSYEKYKEKKVLSNADTIITVSDPLTEVMKKHYPHKKIFTIENGFDPDEFPDWKRNIIPKPTINNKLIISYLGTIYPGKQDPSILLEACNELIQEQIIKQTQIEINFYGDNKKQLEAILKHQVSDKFNIVKIKGFVSRKESLNIQKKSDLLLFLEWNDPSAKGVLTGKLFEYLVSGTPILGVGISNTNIAGKVIEATKTGKLFVNKNDLKKELINIFTNKKIRFYEPNIKEIEKYSREKQVLRLINIMKSLIN